MPAVVEGNTCLTVGPSFAVGRTGAIFTIVESDFRQLFLFGMGSKLCVNIYHYHSIETCSVIVIVGFEIPVLLLSTVFLLVL